MKQDLEVQINDQQGLQLYHSLRMLNDPSVFKMMEEMQRIGDKVPMIKQKGPGLEKEKPNSEQ